MSRRPQRSLSTTVVHGQRQRYTFNLREAIREAEKSVEEQIAAANDAAQKTVNMAAQRVAAEEALYEETKAMQAATEVGVEKFIKRIIDKSEALAELHAERAVLRLDVEEHIPYWMVRWGAFTKWLVSRAHLHGWRDEAKAVLAEMRQLFLNEGKEVVLPQLDEMVVNINAWAPSQFRRAMQAVSSTCQELELKRHTAYSAAYQRLKECDDRLAATKQEMSDRIHASATEAAINKEAAFTRKLGHSMALRATMPPDHDPELPAERSITSELEAFIAVAHGREAPSAMQGEFKEMLAHCAKTGAWKDAFRVYGAMLQCGVPPSQQVYKSMITACKHAEPCNSAAAVAVLAEMRRRRQPVAATMFNRVIDACRIAGAWRRGLTVFQAMVEAGCRPTTVTYETLGKACAKASSENAPEVYAAMKYSGVPEFIAYSASMKAIHGKAPPKEKDTLLLKGDGSAARFAPLSTGLHVT